MLFYIVFLLNIALLQDYESLDTKNISPLLLNNSLSYNERIANDKNTVLLNDLININKYIVGPGDEFYLSFSANNYSFNNYLVVSPTSDIIIPSLGIINLELLSLKEAYEHIENHCKKKYNNANINVTLTDIRSFYINIKGLSYGNSKILINPLTTVVDAFEIFLTTVPSNKRQNVSKRNILLNNDINIDCLINKIRHDHNPYLKEGDILTLNEHGMYFDIYGAVMNPGRYEYLDGDNLSTVVDIAGGYSDFVSKAAVVTRLNSPLININLDIPFDIESYDHILIEVYNKLNNRNMVSISGEINIPGSYVISAGMTVNDLIVTSGGLTDNADINKIYINNNILESEEDLELKRIKIIAPSKRTMSEISYLKSRSIVKKGIIKSNHYETTQKILEYELNLGDEVQIMPEIRYVEIIGAVTNPGRYPFIKSNSIYDYIETSGGKTSRATRSVYIIKSNNQKKKVRGNYTYLENGEVIFVEPKEDFNLWNKLQESMGLVGQLATLLAVIQSASNN